MSDNDELVKGCVYNTPLTLLAIKDEELISKVNNYLPYSTGFEIECDMAVGYNEQAFLDIPNILEVGNSSSEQRYRIPSGANGLTCLYLICEQLKINSLLNEGSGIHYHIDMTDCFHLLTKEFIAENAEWILAELDTWEYKGTYNYRKCEFNTAAHWIRFQSNFKTAEIRIGEMSFDYNILVKRIIHTNQIIKRLKDQLGVSSEIIHSPIPSKAIVEYMSKYSFGATIDYNSKLQELNSKLQELKKVEIEIAPEKPKSYIERIKEITTNRVIKINNERTT